MKEQRRAERIARAMFAQDRASQWMGMELLEVAPGYARLSMQIGPEMVNGHGICHGGVIFALADSAFAFACNTDNRMTVALTCHISFVAPAREGERLVAEAREQAKGGRTGVYDVTVTRADGALVALFRGSAYRTREPVVPPERLGEEE